MACLKLSRGPDFISESMDNENQTCLQHTLGVTDPNMVLSWLFWEPDGCQSIWWEVERHSGGHWPPFGWLLLPLWGQGFGDLGALI